MVPYSSRNFVYIFCTVYNSIVKFMFFIRYGMEYDLLDYGS